MALQQLATNSGLTRQANTSCAGISGTPIILCGRRRSRCPVLVKAASATAVVIETPVQTRGRPLVPTTLEEALSVSRKFNKGFSMSLYTEHSAWIEEVEGEIPAGLRGTLLRNGPGLFEVGGRPVPQPFDADGMVCSISFGGDGRAFFRNRYVRTPGFLAERRSGKQLFRTAFNRGLPDTTEGIFELRLPGMQEPLLRMANPLAVEVKDTANTNVLRWGGKTLALYERGPPHALGPDLATIGPDMLNDTVDGKYMAAHLRTLKQRDGSDRLVMFSMNTAGLDAAMTLYEYDAQFNLLHRTRTTLPGAAFGFFHDLAVTQHFYVLAENPITPDLLKIMTQVPLGRASIAESLGFDARKPTKLHLIPRPGSGLNSSEVRTIQVPGPGTFTFHHANAYEINADGTEPTPLAGRTGRFLVLDAVSAQCIDFKNNTENVNADYYGNTANQNELWRTVVDLNAAAGSAEEVVRHRLLHRAVEFPVMATGMAGRPHTTTYLNACPLDGSHSFFGPLQGLCKVETSPLNGVGQQFDPDAVRSHFWQPDGHAAQFPSEVAFVPRHQGSNPAHCSSDAADADCGHESDGWLMSLVFDAEAEKSHLVILNAADLTAGPVARLQLPHHVPLGLHGMFTTDFMGPSSDTPSSLPYDIRQGVQASKRTAAAAVAAAGAAAAAAVQF